MNSLLKVLIQLWYSVIRSIFAFVITIRASYRKLATMCKTNYLKPHTHYVSLSNQHKAIDMLSVKINWS